MVVVGLSLGLFLGTPHPFLAPSDRSERRWGKAGIVDCPFCLQEVGGGWDVTSILALTSFFLGKKGQGWRPKGPLQTAERQGGFEDLTSPCLSFFACQIGKVTVLAM